MSQSSKTVVEAFFHAFGAGNIEALLNCLHEKVQIVAGGIQVVPLYRSYEGKEGALAFLQNLGTSFETQAFTVENLVAEGNIVFAFGHFKHLVKTTGKLFESDWSLRCEIADGKIISYKFFEDTAAAQAAFSA